MRTRFIPLVLFAVTFAWAFIGSWIANQLYSPHVGPGTDLRRVAIAGAAGGVACAITLGL